MLSVSGISAPINGTPKDSLIRIYKTVCSSRILFGLASFNSLSNDYSTSICPVGRKVLRQYRLSLPTEHIECEQSEHISSCEAAY